MGAYPGRGPRSGFMLVSGAPGSERDVRLALWDLDGVVEVHSLFGEHDMLVRIESDDFVAFREVVSERLGGIPGVRVDRFIRGPR